MPAALTEIPLDDGHWDWRGAEPDRAEHRGRPCVAFGDSFGVATARGVDLPVGTVEVELAVARDRAFHGLVWHLADDANYESFFVRPHQVANPDAAQYTPVCNDVSAWQLYHGSGFCNEVKIPVRRWFTLRVAFADDRGEAYVDDLTSPALVFSRLRLPPAAGRIALLPGGPGVHFAAFAYDSAIPTLRGAPPPVKELEPGAVPGWWVSNIVAEGVAPAAARTWTYLESETSGLANLARVHPLGTTLNTVFDASARSATSTPATRTETQRIVFTRASRPAPGRVARARRPVARPAPRRRRKPLRRSPGTPTRPRAA